MAVAAFNNVRSLLLNPSPGAQNDRQVLINEAAQTKGFARISMGVFGLATVISCIAITSFPGIGILFIIVGSLVTVAARELMVISSNVEEMMRNVFTRGVAALSVNAFVTRITNDTWIVGPFFGAQIEESLENA